MVRHFSDGEIHLQLQENVRGADVFIIQPTCTPVDRNIMELLLISQHPTEAQATTHNFAGQDADLAFLARTQLELLFTSNVPVTEARLKSSVEQPGFPLP